MPAKKNKKSYRKIKHRQKILEFLVDTKLHPNAELIFCKLKKRFRDLTLNTVQRNLRLLKENGQIWELDFGTGLSRFSAAIHFHYHFICNSCQNIYDIRIPPAKELDEKVTQLTGFRIFSHRLVFFGLCDECKLKKQKKNNKNRKLPEDHA